MDPYTEKLIERTRQRRAMLDEKMGKTPDPAPRKRVLTDAVNQPSKTGAVDDDSPKRHCTWETTGIGKPDTPAITGVKSRLNTLSEERGRWSDSKDKDQVENHLSTDRYDAGRTNPPSSPRNRKSRFAQLAQDLDNFECDMSHPSIRKQEERKPKWQPPKRDDDDDDRSNKHNDATDRHVSSPRKEYESYQGPVRGRNNVGGSSPAPSPKKTHAPAPPTAPPLPQNLGPQKPPRIEVQSPTKSPRVAGTQSSHLQSHNVGSPKFTHHVRVMTNQVPVNTRPESTSEEEPTEKPINERLATWQKSVDTPSKARAPNDPTDLPLSERFAGWEQRVSQTPKTSAGPTNRGAQTPKPVNTPAREAAPASTPRQDPCDISSRPVSDIRASWKEQDTKNNPPRESEPTAYSVTDRMSAWEHMSSSNKVSYIKKVDPGSPVNSPAKQPAAISGTPNKATPAKSLGGPKKGLTPQKSFKDSIEERAAQLGRRPTTGGDGLPPKAPANRSPVKSTNSPAKTNQSPTRVPSPKAASPNSKVGSATKSLQQKILQKVQYSKTDQLADRMRQERMAEVNTLNNRYQNGILKDDRILDSSESEMESAPPAPPLPPSQTTSRSDKKENIRAKARQDEGSAVIEFDASAAPPAQRQSSSASKKPSSIYRLVSKKCPESEKPVVKQSTGSLKKVQFQDHNTSTESDSSTGAHMGQHSADTDTDANSADDFDPHSEETHSETTQDSFDETYNSGSESSIPESYRSPGKRNANHMYPQAVNDFDEQSGILTEEDDVSMSAFVPESVRRQSMMPSSNAINADRGSTASEDSAEYDGQYSGGEYAGQDHTRKHLRMEDDSEYSDEGDSAEMDALLDEAMDDMSGDEVDMRREPVPQPRRKRQSHMYATTQGEVQLPEGEQVQMRSKSDGLAYSVSMYRNSSHGTAPVNQRIVRNSHYTQQRVHEEDVQMPTQLPPDVQRKTVHERIKELNELVTQEQTVILQTSNALNKCCSGDSQFAGSAEQVECNRLLLLSCQRRQSYLTEAQRLKETQQLEPPNQQGPKGSLTISDIRIPLKKDFVTKIGSASDNTVHYFIILIRNGAQVIQTQMLSTHDPLMRGSLDFPNLIKIHGISANFKITLEIYSMSVSREQLKDKKKKTPKKSKYTTHMPLESPGGPTAIRTTSFFLITTQPITMKSMDKSSFSLERVPYLSPLHGMIYMRLKCMMEQHVEERGFLTMFEDVSGLGSWHRRWCVIAGNKLCYWKYPDEENKKDPIGLIDLKRVVTEKVGLIPRDICARPHTFELVSVRPPRKGEQDTLVTKTYSTLTTTRFMLSADTKEERIVWCNKVNRALANIRTWHSDAMRPIKAPREKQ